MTTRLDSWLDSFLFRSMLIRLQRPALVLSLAEVCVSLPDSNDAFIKKPGKTWSD